LLTHEECSADAPASPSRRATTRDFASGSDIANGRATCVAATVLGEEGNECIHSLEMRRVDELPALSFLGDEPRSHEVVEMERE
jgi:hypothetical protein